MNVPDALHASDGVAFGKFPTKLPPSYRNRSRHVAVHYNSRIEALMLIGLASIAASAAGRAR